ncbi:hypothetical protein NH8B_0006 [Pseudogulbenkiania sp. NH8B]|uniref:hypothetical protein n=1 Tax=Pseudogulbenkiania sp. (strain NH8B) TaxID=748280 RepID=UPI00022796EE|nr:hypothetical protein [Pseudogulbenkiania sp. NH8B]BAK74855.1 hypothetical protein NH8B_0006 [Pseudogulbenkiania sp. NH8B]
MARSNKSRPDYTTAILDFVSAAPSRNLVDLEAITNLFPTIKEATVRKKVKEAMALHPSLCGRIAGVFPDTKAILDEIERQLGSAVVGETLVRANQLAKTFVEGLANAFANDFCTKALNNHINQATGEISIHFNELITHLVLPYEEYLTKSGNSLVSIAGTLNQSLLVRALRNSGLTDTQPRIFSETGTRSEGDIQIYYRPTGRTGDRTLYVEAKSYAARERLLRGLADMHEPKVGVGFFNDPTEFNEERVTSIVNSAHAKAIYMPTATYAGLAQASRNINIPGTGRVCRKLESEFVEDMIYFTRHGSIINR